ncbi:tripartite tricarboxylate transporter permease [Noviherbaspirillum saxi]|uniref:Tripartite tricarboxylate transporter permease n=1 Tax=Noviherbaspirillum saxi TaxID=2320863 RepID=A0A3A3FJ04_9BURK|nr:tripartite tricarboxylate transporter permease [Noviherbaspirillum saxi]RJF95473.1 tripartite tricarboxylate transporter permease [Noviherbaspirillum saxi]
MFDILTSLMAGFAAALTPYNLMWGFLGCLLGTAIGVLPGIGPALTVAVLLPLTAKVDPTGALIMFAGIYYGAQFGGSTTSILMNAPGESSSMVTAMEGNLMARNGRAGPALATAAIGSFFAGTIATILLTFVAPFVAEVALKFGPAEYFTILIFAFTTVSAVLGASMLRGMASLGIGLAIGLIGMDSISGTARYTYGVPELVDGIEVVLVAVSLFAVAEALYSVMYDNGADGKQNRMSSLWMTREDWKRSVPAWIRGTALGFPFGSIPAGGAEIPTFLSYSTERKLTKHPEEFAANKGAGAIEGVAGPEAANNACVTGSLVPLLTLGIPTSATAAILLAAFQNYNLQPGPLLFQTSADIVWALVASLYIGNVILLLLNLPLVGVWVRLLSIPRQYLNAGILVFATIGVFSMRQSSFDLLLMFAIGWAGVLMRRYDFPVAPVIVGMLLGPMAEKQLRNALSISQGDWLVFVTQPLSASILAATCIVLFVPMYLRKRGVQLHEDD